MQNSKLRFHLTKILSLSMMHVAFLVAPVIMFTLAGQTKYNTFFYT